MSVEPPFQQFLNSCAIQLHFKSQLSIAALSFTQWSTSRRNKKMRSWFHPKKPVMICLLLFESPLKSLLQIHWCLSILVLLSSACVEAGPVTSEFKRCAAPRAWQSANVSFLCPASFCYSSEEDENWLINFRDLLDWTKPIPLATQVRQQALLMNPSEGCAVLSVTTASRVTVNFEAAISNLGSLRFM